MAGVHKNRFRCHKCDQMYASRENACGLPQELWLSRDCLYHDICQAGQLGWTHECTSQLPAIQMHEAVVPGSVCA